MNITSINNDKVIFWSKLKNKKTRDDNNLFVVESPHLVNEALKKGVVKEIITTNEMATYNVETYYVSEKVMKKISSLVCPTEVMAVCSYIIPDKIVGNVLVIDRLQDPGNLGTIIRSAVAFNFQTIIVSDDTVDTYNDKVIRSSEGMLFNINIIKAELTSMIPLLKENGYKVIGTDVIDAKQIKDYKNDKCAYIIGNEGRGISSKVKELCDGFVKIPMENSVESLNAAVASSIIMYEVYNG